MHAGVWAIGEYGDVLVRNEVVDPEEQQLRVTEQNVLDLLESIIRSPYTSDTGREYVMTALMKLSTRFPNSQEYVGHAPARTQDCMHACMHGHGADPALSGMRCTGASAPSCRASPAARASSCSSVPPSTSPSSASTAFGACRRIPLAALVDRLPRSPAVLIAAHPALILCEQLGLAGAHADPGAARGQPPDPPCWRYGGLAPSATGLNWGPLTALGARLRAAADRIRGRGWPDTVPGSGWVGLARGVPPGGCGVAGAWRSLRDERVQNAWLTWAVASSVGVSVARLQASAAANLLELDLSECHSLKDSVFDSMASEPPGTPGVPGGEALSPGCPRLRVLKLGDCEALRSAELRSATLESLQLSQCRWLLMVQLDCPMLTQVRAGVCVWRRGVAGAEWVDYECVVFAKCRHMSWIAAGTTRTPLLLLIITLLPAAFPPATPCNPLAACLPARSWRLRSAPISSL